MLEFLSDSNNVVLCEICADLMWEKSTAVFQRQQLEDFSQVSAVDDARQDLIIVAVRSINIHMHTISYHILSTVCFACPSVTLAAHAKYTLGIRKKPAYNSHFLVDFYNSCAIGNSITKRLTFS